MKRVDRLMDECRLLRIHRALRARKREGFDPTGVDWQGECDIAGRLVEDLTEVEAEGRLPIDVIDATALATLVPRLVEALAGVLAGSPSEAEIVEASMPKLDSYLAASNLARQEARDLAGGQKPKRPERRDLHGRVIPPIDERNRRKAAMADVAALVVETALFEAVRQTIANRDLARDVRGFSYVETIRIEDGRVRRNRKVRPLAERGKGRRSEVAASSPRDNAVAQ